MTLARFICNKRKYLKFFFEIMFQYFYLVFESKVLISIMVLEKIITTTILTHKYQKVLLPKEKY